ncbi:hypothetical protein L1277_002769 [Okibacterium sp. HSC-33S16]|uniref:ion channel n=1 Tax=Okibacterium sp. HSC-33S16 TaxID=2910965 RepID=UPI00209DD059|nr:ion channel [Okibacterium sp. HSC-33S16]MCP2032659.1 hypothetical protein [Okibacterium sp. HSC-33S16]
MTKPRRTKAESLASTAHPVGRHPSSWRSGYWLVLTLLTVSYLMCAAQTSPDPSAVVLLVQLATVAATLWVARVNAGVRQVGWVVLAVTGTAAGIVQLAALEGRVLDIVLSSASMLAYLGAPIAIIAHQGRKVLVDGQTLLASIAAYVMVGMFFTFVYNLIGLTTATPLFENANDDSLTSQLFFSFTTLTTTGYGNLVPSGSAVQSVAIAEAIAGQLFLVIAVARVVSGWQPQRR